ncbi:LysR family transcriptional regulator [Alteromonas sp. KS69]|jgi:DNA-binding transcriptional LysR family regulator|uniref:LysR family transcriptional regulator n=1 Tax=unclassified Alteromonas TaxID=2614992 RepID=UPI000C0F86D5|nr:MULTISPECIES: LysR family transcriptional regulator [unclassified Alteromonas]MBO7923844.1 LysR family transcriptional regulator [Alteromonas sp. K632G]PHS49442.1 MAG: LysR family transcriptional regulator [Alteromonas sp.]RUP79695.1 LysR family transcriptional regulator [Alteromonas sp. KS69]|tara:strand:+ start:2624 stop:3514 length:891 start_codon:yes stop_codon:yes gene_type:complete
MESFEGIIEFVAVAERKGFSAAAKQLGCSTSHISRQVARLEERVGCVLLARSTRQVNLTENGALYYQHAKDLLIGLQQANEQVSLQQVTLEGVLRVSAAGGFAEHAVAPALMQFALEHPELTIDMDFNSRMVNFVEDDVDFVIRYGELADSSLIARKLIERPMMAVATRDYLAQCGEPSHPSELKKHSCVISNNDVWKFSNHGVQENIKVKGRWRSNNANAVLAACEQGLGIGYMPKSTFSASVEAGRLQPILQPYWGDGASSWIVYQNKRFMPLRVRMAIDYLVQYFTDWEDKAL